MNLEKLSKEVFKLNFTDKTSEDYVYFQIIKYLAEFGSFTLTELDEKIIIYKKTNGKNKKSKIERRKLKKILNGTAKNFKGLIPLNYVRAIQTYKNRGGNKEYEYYLTEKGIMASLGHFSYKQNINLKKIFKSLQYPNLKPHQKFIKEFIELQIHVFLFYHYIGGISLAFKQEHTADYDKFRAKMIQFIDIRTLNKNDIKEFEKLLDDFNLYRKIHQDLIPKFSILSLIWDESYDKPISQYGFQGWYRLQFLTQFDKNLKLKKYPKHKINQQSTTITSLSEPEFIYHRFQENTPNIPQASLDRKMLQLGLKKQKNKANLQNLYLDNPY